MVAVNRRAPECDGVRRIRQLGVWGSISEAVVSAGMDRTGCDAGI